MDGSVEEERQVVETGALYERNGETLAEIVKMIKHFIDVSVEIKIIIMACLWAISFASESEIILMFVYCLFQFVFDGLFECNLLT